MKTAAMVTMMILAASVYAQDGTQEQSYFGNPAKHRGLPIAKAERNYLACLQSTNEGVVESALAHVAMMKLVLPTFESKALQEKVWQMSRKAAEPEMRYKAFLTANVLEQPKVFSGIEWGRYNSADELFDVVASRLSRYYAIR